MYSALVLWPLISGLSIFELFLLLTISLTITHPLFLSLTHPLCLFRPFPLRSIRMRLSAPTPTRRNAANAKKFSHAKNALSRFVLCLFETMIVIPRLIPSFLSHGSDDISTHLYLFIINTHKSCLDNAIMVAVISHFSVIPHHVLLPISLP